MRSTSEFQNVSNFCFWQGYMLGWGGLLGAQVKDTSRTKWIFFLNWLTHWFLNWLTKFEQFWTCWPDGCLGFGIVGDAVAPFLWSCSDCLVGIVTLCIQFLVGSTSHLFELAIQAGYHLYKHIWRTSNHSMKLLICSMVAALDSWE